MITATPAPVSLHHADSDADIRACFAVMQELRPHLDSADTLLQRIRSQQRQGYRLLAAWRDGRVIALAGYRFQENLVHGPFLYVDDLVTQEQDRGTRLGQHLLDTLRDTAREQGCVRLVLDTGLGNALAQRFYYRQGMLALAMRFAQDLH